MTSTPVTDVKSFFMNFAANASGNVTDVNASFTDALNKQMGNGTNDADATDTGIRTDSKGKTDVDVRNTRNLQDKAETSKTETDTDSTKALDKLAETAKDAVKAVAEELNVSEEEVLQAMENLGFTPMDLLQTENLAMVVMEVAGENDALTLLTDENLYASLQSLTKQIQTQVSQIQEQLGLTDEQMQTLLTEAVTQVPEDNMTEQMQLPEKTTEAVNLPSQTNPQTQPDITVQTENSQEELKESPLPSQEGEEAQNLEGTGEETMKENIPEKVSNAAHAGDTRQENAGSGREQTNPMLQNLNPGQVQTQDFLFTEQYVDNFTQNTKEIMDQIMEFMKVQVKPEMSQLEMQLHPESLGTLNVSLSSKEGVVTAHFVTQSEEVKAALESQMVQLKTNFSEQGVKVEAVEVSVQSNAFKKEYEQSREEGSGQEETERKKTVRRINLSSQDLSEEELTEEEAITTQMMQANGNTVDYTA